MAVRGARKVRGRGDPARDSVTAEPSSPEPVVPGDATAAGPSIASYFGSFSRSLSWEELCTWPPDVFAFCNLVLDHTEAYRFAVAPPPGRRWPPLPDWNRRVMAAGEDWRIAAGGPRPQAPASVRRHWDVITQYLDLPIAALRRGDGGEVWEALLSLHAVADETCAGLAAAGPSSSGRSFEHRAWDLLADQGSLSHIDPARVRVMPKTHLAARGISIRSFSRYIALTYESVDIQWQRVEPEIRSRMAVGNRRNYNIVLAPWPLQVPSRAFRPVESPLENMDRQAFGFFEFSPEPAVDLDLLARMLQMARRGVRNIDALIFPEASVEASEIASIEDLLSEFGVTFLIAGVRSQASSNGLGRNYIHLGIQTTAGWDHYEQAKHHRWCLDHSQIRQYHLSRPLDPSKLWWEAIDLPARTIQIIDVGGGATIAPLVCEDLARMDEVAYLLRCIGPSLVVTLLLDGPQLAGRWPNRYASVLTDEPGSAVLTLTSFGMAARSTPPGVRLSRAVALWNDPTSGLHQLDLGRGASGILITASVGVKTVWTADGRRHENNTPSIVISGVHQLRTPATAAGRR